MCAVWGGGAVEGERGGEAMRPKARELAQHGGPSGWLEESDPYFERNGLSLPDGPYHLTRNGADLFLNVHETPS
jgi:hypothetical protein